MTWFGHSGDMGDVIYALPTIKAMGGGILPLLPARQDLARIGRGPG